VVVGLHDFAIQDGLQILEVEHHPGHRVGIAAQSNLHDIIVSMAMRIGGRAVQGAVLLVVELRIAAHVRRGKLYFAGDQHGLFQDAEGRMYGTIRL